MYSSSSSSRPASESRREKRCQGHSCSAETSRSNSKLLPAISTATASHRRIPLTKWRAHLENHLGSASRCGSPKGACTIWVGKVQKPVPFAARTQTTVAAGRSECEARGIRDASPRRKAARPQATGTARDAQTPKEGRLEAYSGLSLVRQARGRTEEQVSSLRRRHDGAHPETQQGRGVARVVYIRESTIVLAEGIHPAGAGEKQVTAKDADRGLA